MKRKIRLWYSESNLVTDYDLYSLVIDQLHHQDTKYAPADRKRKINVCGNFEIFLVKVNQSTKSDDFCQSITDSIYVENFEASGLNQ